MKGYPYPDNHKVHYILYGDRGLIAKGMIMRVRQGVFRLAEGVDPAEFPGAEQQAKEPRSEDAATGRGFEVGDDPSDVVLGAPVVA